MLVPPSTDPFRQECKVTCRFGNLKLSMFTDPTKPRAAFPKLKGRAAEIRHLGPALLHFWEQRMDPASPQHKMVHMALKASCAIETILDAYPRAVRLPEEAVADFHSAVQAFLACSNALSAHFAAAGQKLFNITIKYHYLAHAAEQAKWLNPRLGWCYAGEDYMNKVKRTASSCLRGTPPDQVSEKMLRKYRVGMHLRFSGVRSV